MTDHQPETEQTIHFPACHLVDPRRSLNTCVGCGGSTLLDPPCQPARDVPLTRADAVEDDGPECDLCGLTTCPDADLPEFSEPVACEYLPIYEALRHDRCEYGCARDITKATIRRDIVPTVERLRSLSKPTEVDTAELPRRLCDLPPPPPERPSVLPDPVIPDRGWGP